jgi:hypothetical protein
MAGGIRMGVTSCKCGGFGWASEQSCWRRCRYLKRMTAVVMGYSDDEEDEEDEEVGNE